AVKLAPIMQDMFDKRDEGGGDERTPINLYADEGSNALICSSSRDDQAIVQGLLELLDKPSTIARQFRIFPLSKAKAQPLAQTLDELFQSQAEAAGGDARADAIAVRPDERTNALIVWAAPTEMDNIEAIIERLDTTEPAVEMAVRVIQLKQALAEDLAQVLEDSLIGETGGVGEDSQAVIVSYMALKEDGTREERKLVRQDLSITPEARTNTLTVMAPADSMDMLEAIIRDFDTIRPILAEIRLFPLVNADAEEVVERLEELFEAEGGEEGEQTLTFGTGEGSVTVAAAGEGGVRQQVRFSADRRTNTVIAAGSEMDLNMVEQLIYQLDAQDAEERVTLVYEVRNTTAEAVTEAIRAFAEDEQERLGELEDEASLMRQAERHITAISDEQSNSVVLGVSPRYYDQYMTLIHELDRPPPQVMIQVLVAEVTLDDRVDLGLDFAVQDLHFTEHAVAGPNGTVLGKDFDFVAGTDLGAGAGALGGFNFTITGEDFSFLLRALQSDSKLEVLQRPILMVENNEEANITIGDRVPIVQGSTFTEAGNTSTQVTYENVGIILDVTPHINPDGYVNLEVHPEISQISGSSVQLTEGLAAPVFSERSAETVITVKDGETVVIGGLITNTETDNESKVPILGDIPGLGVLFRNTSHQVRKTELLMVLTVHVLRTEDDVRTQSVEQRDKTGLLGNISRHPLMEGLRIRAEENGLAPTGPEALEERPRVEPDRELYGPTPDVYGPPIPRPTRVEAAQPGGGTPVVAVYGPPVPVAASADSWARMPGARRMRAANNAPLPSTAGPDSK
ncbi:MAG: secretin N-terminal domain-containing protein, partial [Planctomycetota bacterium]